MIRKQRIVLGISGASGAVIGVTLLRELAAAPDIETHLVITRSAERTLLEETDTSKDALFSSADVVYDNNDVGAAIASGTFRTIGMIVAPCSMKSLAGIANGYSDNLMLRAADVALKERRKLVLLTRESPLSAIHLRNMLELTRAGAIIMPPVVSYYNGHVTLEDINRQIAGRALDQFGISIPGFARWA
ncbi:MAG: UbiX family flavin prenyltransferase [Clostridiales Family XIII bacterium]|jgi:4-hydroxy-3-polyprenylbenzoate decarboxylase|nr:UbiX family flavin prenyltransferase [Clostridiales Family XIII bacterium]